MTRIITTTLFMLVCFLPDCCISKHEIEFMPKPTYQDIEFLTEKINADTSDYGDVRTFAFFIRDENNQIIAGANAYIIFGVVHTDQLWVHPDYRLQGLGRKLMENIEEYARDNGCKIATVNTMSFLAVKFYERLGYQKDFERSGYSKESNHIFFSKKLG